MQFPRKLTARIADAPAYGAVSDPKNRRIAGEAGGPGAAAAAQPGALPRRAGAQCRRRPMCRSTRQAKERVCPLRSWCRAKNRDSTPDPWNRPAPTSLTCPPHSRNRCNLGHNRPGFSLALTIHKHPLSSLTVQSSIWSHSQRLQRLSDRIHWSYAFGYCSWCATSRNFPTRHGILVT